MVIHIHVHESSIELAQAAAVNAARILQGAVSQKGSARLVLSTGASQLEMLSELRKQSVSWEKVEMFHLDEYIGISALHPSSFRRYLREHFTRHVSLKSVHEVVTEGDVAKQIEHLTFQLRQRPVDLSLIGIGENAHIAFNDPPADLQTRAAFLVVDLDENCKRQQVREGWFPSVHSVPSQAVSMSVYEIMQSRRIISVVPYAVKARAVKDAVTMTASAEIPASILRMHPQWDLYLDQESSSLLNESDLGEELIE